MSPFRLTWGRHKALYCALGIAAGGGAAVIYKMNSTVKAMDLVLHPPKFPWYHNGLFRSFDHASMRRGYEVYKQVCAACHSMKFLHFRNLIGVTHSEEEAKAEAADTEVEDGPNEVGDMFMRPGKLSDVFPNPYKNPEQARAANNGALPPDLSYIILGREGNENYVFSILTGYTEEIPANFPLGDGQHYNPYFSGGAIGMAQALFTDMIEYEDGTPASQSQMAKDVVSFLKWAGETHFDEAALMLLKGCFIFPILLGVTYYYYRKKFSVLKSMKIIYTPKYSPPKKSLSVSKKSS